MLSKNQIKLINALKNKKGRQQHKLFIVEGEKMTEELLSSNFKVHGIYALGSWINENSNNVSGLNNVVEVAEDELKKVSLQTNPNKVLCLARIPDNIDEINEKEPVIALEDIRDPGNLGTIIRTADWFGIKQIVCSPNSVDVFNPKVVQSTMGAVFRVKVRYIEFEEFLHSSQQKKYGAFLGGENIYSTTLADDGVYVFGNESLGISKETEMHVDKKITIPHCNSKSESLNLSTSVAIFCSELRRELIRNEMKS
ncbi:RNA methyltransferase [Bacteroidales bacterium]|nr:RNA methyltransferase [Bacteroidales bacterium]